MRRYGLIASVLVLISIPVIARIRTIDIAPAATLLIPYFETDPYDPNGVDTLVTIQNASATATVAHVVLWTDYGLPTATFDFYLTGYDQETFSLRGAMNRYLPVTADAGDDPQDTSDPNDGISNKGVLSQDINFPGVKTSDSCIASDLPQAHMGLASTSYFGGQCGARAFNDGIARGYITIDTVNSFNVLTPDTPFYFTSITTNQNILLGEVTYLDKPNGRMFTEPAVHIEAGSGSSYPPIPNGELTFYARFNGQDASDQREALPTAWAGSWSANRTSIEYWRDPAMDVAPFPCGTTPYTLDERQVRAYDANGAVVATSAGDPFPRAAGVTNAATQLGLTNGFGWLFMNLNTPAGGTRQSWITMRNVPLDRPADASAGYSTHGIQLGNAMNDDDPVKP